MCGLSAVTSISERCDEFRRCARGSARCRRRSARRSSRMPSASSRTLCRKLWMISGLKTFSSKLPDAPPMLMATSLPITCAHDHRQRLALRRVDLARHDRASPARSRGCVSSPRPQRGPAASQRTSLAIFISARGQRLQRAVRVHERVVRGQRRELVRRGHERQAGQLARARAATRSRELRVRVQAGADRRAAERELAQVRQRGLDVRSAVVELRDVAGELLAERERRRVLQVRAADLDDVGERRRPSRASVSRSCVDARAAAVRRSPRRRRCASRSGTRRSTTGCG